MYDYLDSVQASVEDNCVVEIETTYMISSVTAGGEYRNVEKVTVAAIQLSLFSPLGMVVVFDSLVIIVLFCFSHSLPLASKHRTQTQTLTASKVVTRKCIYRKLSFQVCRPNSLDVDGCRPQQDGFHQEGL